MAILPGSGYLSDDVRTEGEMKVAMELLRDVIAEIGSKEIIIDEISDGSIDAPLATMISVTSEGGASILDELNSIGTANITQGRIVILKNTFNATTATTLGRIQINHSTSAGSVEMLDGENFILCSKRQLALIYTGNHWVELWRTYGRNTDNEKLKEREDMALGTASVETIATSIATTGSGVLKVGGPNLSANDILKVNSSGNIVVATAGDFSGVNATTLDNIDSTGFVRSNASAAQTIDESLTLVSGGNTTLIITDTGGSSTPGVSLKAGNPVPNERASIFVTSTNGISEWRTKTAAGVTSESVRLNPTSNQFEFSPSPGNNEWESLTPGPGNGLNADKLDGEHLATIYSTLRNEIKAKVYMPLLEASSTSLITSSPALIIRRDIPESVQAFAGKWVKVDYRFFVFFSGSKSFNWWWSLENGLNDPGVTDRGNLDWIIHTSSGISQHNCKQGSYGYMQMPESYDSLVLQVQETSNTSGNPTFILYDDETGSGTNFVRNRADDNFPEFAYLDVGAVPQISWLTFQLAEDYRIL